jgi:hypothetical protein
MKFTPPIKLALLYPGDRAARTRSDPKESRFAALFEAFAQAGVSTEPCVWHDDFAAEVRAQLLKCDAVLVWANPIEAGRTRLVLDALLADVAGQGVVVSTHPGTIAKLGTKDVLLAVRDLPFGSDVQRVDSLEQLREELPQRLKQGARVLKQHRGHSGMGVWRVEFAGSEQSLKRVRLRHAQRGSVETIETFETVLSTLAPYFSPEAGQHMIDQAWQSQLPRGMVRAYLVGKQVAGFGHQAVVALHPTDEPGPRLYSDASDERFQGLRQLLDNEWIDLLLKATGVSNERIPMLWDCDFLYGSAQDNEQDSWVLCEINVSSVSPYPPSVNDMLVQHLKAGFRPMSENG